MGERLHKEKGKKNKGHSQTGAERHVGGEEKKGCLNLKTTMGEGCPWGIGREKKGGAILTVLGALRRRGIEAMTRSHQG